MALRRGADPCGCAFGAKCMFAALAAGLLLLIVSRPSSLWLVLRGLGRAVVLGVAGAAIGKLVGIRRDRRRAAASGAGRE